MVVSTCSFGARRSSSSWSAAGVFQIQTDINMTAAARHVAQFSPRRALSDPGYVIKTILTEAFGGPVLRPWALRAQRQQHAVIVAYSSKPIDEITSRLGLALPSVRTCIGEVFGYPVPELAKEQRLRYTVRLCPTIRSTNRGETDAFLLAADMVSPDAGLTRDAIYREYLAERLAGVRLNTCRLEGFQLHAMVRKREGGSGLATRKFPDAVLSGELTLVEPSLFMEVLAKGVGRQRAFGYGMVMLQPATA
jgi:CRISPR system Cascade subunit CasE